MQRQEESQNEVFHSIDVRTYNNRLTAKEFFRYFLRRLQPCTLTKNITVLFAALFSAVIAYSIMTGQVQSFGALRALMNNDAGFLFLASAGYFLAKESLEQLVEGRFGLDVWVSEKKHKRCL